MNTQDSWSSPSDPHEPNPPAKPCVCMAEDAEAAYNHIRASDTTETFADESHFIVTLKQCDACGQLFLSIFTELIDWSDGDDSQAWMCMPITNVEAALLRSASEVDDRFILNLELSGRHLTRIYPRGQECRIGWSSGPLVILPHD